MSHNSNKGDELGKALRDGEVAAFPLLVQGYQLRLYRLILPVVRSHQDAEDVVQETFVQVLNKIESWHGDNFNGWIFRIARNLAIDFIRKNNVRSKINIAWGQQAMAANAVYDQNIIAQERQQKIREILNRLPLAQREILDLKHFQQYTIRAIAQKRKCAEGTIKATLYQTFQKLKQEFSAAGLME